ncbi:2-C-methyl-D-erythritol 4-phosphate cytidylyltransferase [Aridibaculum aurantiacum]|uniref:2-C-methyl-D-erythritol 4-phosphate cytidylyltransferase n=1 Tax=Aridibaculum aurantiacum TaxID=2810307 RepID=UPI001A95F3DB|nr:2-C-methyl-D-erythritol 4-phosphate cytidylyltransferase [Aridibaculum aurantiacum]
MKKYAVIVAGGSGVRMGGAVPKQFLLLKGKPVISYTLQAFLQVFEDLHVILVLPQNHVQEGEAIVQSMKLHDRVTIVQGGDSRFQSVKNGLAHVTDPSVVFVHDGVRCMVSHELIKQCYEQALDKGSAIPAIAATDSIRIAEASHHYVMDRNKVRIIQTPQTFLSSVLLPAFEQPYNDAFTDEATVVEANDVTTHLINGEESNIKITRPLDLLIAEAILDKRIT